MVDRQTYFLVSKLQIVKLLGIPIPQTRKLLRCAIFAERESLRLGPQIANTQIATLAENPLIQHIF
jgi:hypothetical protein